MFLTMWVAATVLTATPPRHAVQVQAGARDRRHAIASLVVPEGLRARGSLHLRARTGAPWPVQIDRDGRGWFVIPRMSAGASIDLVLEPTPAPPSGAVLVAKEGTSVEVRMGTRTVLRYQGEGALPRPEVPSAYLRGGYLHPLFTPSGRLVTDDYPPNHLHHHGVWFSWANTRFEGRAMDFWNMGKKAGKTDFVSFIEATGGPVMAVVRGRHVHLDLGSTPPRPALEEEFSVRVFRTHASRAPYHLIDLEVEDRAAGPPVELGRYLYGGLGVRGHRRWNGAAASWFLTSSGFDRVTGNQTRARWVHLGGAVDGKLAGVAVLAHPENPNAPEPVRCHPQEPFLAFAPVQNQAITIERGRPHRARYRLVVADGPPSAAQLEELWGDLASPAQVSVRSTTSP